VKRNRRGGKVRKGEVDSEECKGAGNLEPGRREECPERFTRVENPHSRSSGEKYWGSFTKGEAAGV